MTDNGNTTSCAFPEPDDWGGWVNFWCRDDTGNVDCVPEPLRPAIAHLVRPDGYLKNPDSIPNTPYKIARWFHISSSGKPRPPWIGTGLTPYDARRLWEDEQARVAAEAQAVEDAKADLYFIQSSDDGPIKIGITGLPIRKRMKALQTAHPFQLHLRALIKAEGMRETEYHARFAAHRLHGEWFVAAPEILAEIDRLKALPA